MGLLKTVFDLQTLRFRPGLQKRLSDELLFEMPRIGMDPVVILGGTRATALMAAAAFNAGHKRFAIVGGKEVGDEDPRFTRLLVESIEKAGLPLPSDPKIKEYQYGREVLNHLGVTGDRIFTREYDRSTNLQQNMEVLKQAGYANFDSVEMYTLAATARRVIGTARKVWDDHQKVIAVHNVYPTGITRENWSQDPASRFYALSEAEKVLPDASGVSNYERRGFCRPVSIAAEVARVESYIGRKNHPFNGPKAEGPV